LTATVNSNSVF